MALDPKLVKKLRQALTAAEEHRVAGPRLVDDAERLWRRLESLIALHIVPDDLDLEGLELATYALQLPLRRAKTLPSGKPARSSLRERAEEAAELLVGAAPDNTDELLLDRTTRLLHEMPHKSPILDEAKLLADALNLEDFGLTGLVALAVQLGRQGEGILQAADGFEKREQYGYWSARLKDGFHFEVCRQLASRRLEAARQAAALLLKELKDDGS